MKKNFIIIVTVLAFGVSFPGTAQAPQDSLRKDALNVYMEATDYLKKEIPYVNYVRDIKDAGVYIISTMQMTGSGGRERTYFFVGQHEFAGMRDTVSFVTTPDETEEGARQKEVSTLKMALLRYVQKTPLSKYIRISFSQPLSETVSSDKWNSWVFRTSMNGYLNGRKTSRQNYLSGNISAARVTEEWKININGRLNQNETRYFINDSTTITGSNDSKSFNAMVVNSLGDHWSIGGRAMVGASSYSNERFAYTVMPGIEYDLFPYSESTRRQLRVLYTIGFTGVNYIDSTIYDKIRDNLWQQSLMASYQVVQKWGSIDLSLSYSNYLHDWSKNNLSVDGFFELRIAKGLSINIGGSASMIHDQLGLVKQDIPIDQILLQRKELATQFDYFTSFGFSYTFGSIYNNVVNPRFGNSGGGGGMVIIR
jgi:hypothetical protein